MQVILKDTINKIGQKGQSVTVKPGFYRNYLLPRGLAEASTKKSLARAEAVNQKVAEEAAKIKKEAEKIRETLKDLTLNLKEKLNKKGTLFAKVSAKEVAQAIKDQAKIEVSTSQVSLKETIKSTGTFEANVKLGSGVTATVRLIVEGITEEA
jgi:large subunit ribosomal protein L9